MEVNEVIGSNYDDDRVALIQRIGNDVNLYVLRGKQLTFYKMPFVPTSMTWIGDDKLFVVFGPFAAVITQTELYTLSDSLPAIKTRLDPITKWLNCNQNLCIDGQLTAAALHNNKRYFFGKTHYWTETTSGSLSAVKPLSGLNLKHVNGAFGWDRTLWYFAGDQLLVTGSEDDKVDPALTTSVSVFAGVKGNEVKAAFALENRAMIFFGCCW